MREISKIAIGCDHAGFEYKKLAIEYLTSKGFDCQDFGTHSEDSVDYPDFAHPVANEVESSTQVVGVLICGSANGVAMTANKHQGIRAGICWSEEIASLTRMHNDANICCIPARFISIDQMKNILDVFLSTDFEGGRHQNRVNNIGC